MDTIHEAEEEDTNYILDRASIVPERSTANTINTPWDVFVKESIAAGVGRGDEDSFVSVTDPVANRAAMEAFALTRRKEKGDNSRNSWETSK